MSAPLVIGSLRTPGSLGLSTENSALADDPNIALTLDNAVYDSRGRICARKGWTLLTSEGNHGEDTVALHEYVVSASSKLIISAANGNLYEGTTELVSKTGALTPTNDDWQFVNFNGVCIGVQAGETPIAKSGAGSFADLSASSGTLPTGNAALSAFGRLWITDNNEKTVKFSGSLDEEDWGGAGAGQVDTEEVWPDGLDKVVALAEWQGKLVMFGERSILIYENPEDPSAAAFGLADTIRVGCAARDSVAAVANDLVFLGIDGLHSLQRAIEFSNVPQAALALAVRTELADDIAQVRNTPSAIKCAYSRLDSFYLCRIGSAYWSFDMRAGTARASKWYGIGFKSLAAATDGTLYLGQNDGVASYSGYKDNAAGYQFRYASAFLDLAEGREVYPKTARATLITTGDYIVTLTTAYDYQRSEQASQYQLMTARIVSEWQPAGVATTSAHEWGTAEWSGVATSVVSVPFDLSGAGARVQIGLRVNVEDYAICVQRIDITSRLGRIAA